MLNKKKNSVAEWDKNVRKRRIHSISTKIGMKVRGARTLEGASTRKGSGLLYGASHFLVHSFNLANNLSFRFPRERQ